MAGFLGQLNQSMQQGVPALGQVTGTSPNFDPQLQPNAPSPMPNGSPMTAIHRAAARRGVALNNMPEPPLPPDQAAMGLPQHPVMNQPQVTLPVNDQNPQEPGTQVPVSEAELIIKALTSRLKKVGDHESAVRDHLFPPQDKEAGE